MTRILWAVILLCSGFMAQAKNIVVVFPQQIPPWVNNDGTGGIAVEIVKKSLAISGLNLVPHFVPFSRMSKAINEKYVHAVAMVEGRKVKGNFFYSDPTTKFTTSLISLSENKFVLSDIQELRGKRVLAFLDARNVFKDVGLLAKNNLNYEEMSNQQSQVAMLFKKRTDFILIDRNIFNYWRNTLTYVNTSAALTFHDLPSISSIVVESPTELVFKNVVLRDQFNTGLRQLRNSGEYLQIVNKHLRWCTPAGSTVN